MHEMAIAESLFSLVIDEMNKHNCTHLISVEVTYGAMAGIMPEALQLSFELIANESNYKNVKLNFVCIPIKLKCSSCGFEFEVKESDYGMITPCSICGEQLGHILLQGNELFLSNLEAE